jgi:uncharacterized alkaline shock family protein YloU
VSIIDRILLIILALAGVLSAAIVIVLALGYTNIAFEAMATYPNNIYWMVIGLFLVLVSLRFFFYRVSQPSDHFLVLPGVNGSIRISFETIEQLANRTGKLIRGVHEFETRVRSGESGVLLSVRVKALPDIDLAQMSTEIQQAVKSYVEKTSGCVVERITVNVTELANTNIRPPRAWAES